MKKKNILKKIIRFNKNKYNKYLRLPIEKNAVLLEGGQGKNLNGNMFYLLKELENNPRWEKYQPYYVVTLSNIDKAKDRFGFYKFSKVKPVIRGSNDYQKILATSKCLLTDNSFPTYFCKRPEQLYINTWHGSVLGRLGRSDIIDATSLGNIQKNMFMADYLLFPNERTRNTFFKDYMLDNLFSNKELMLDYCRNDALRDKTAGLAMKKKLGLNNNQVIAYMPTWRAKSGRVADVTGQKEIIQEQLKEWDSKLNDQQKLLVNLHFLVGNDIDYSSLKHTLPFPSEYETYEVLNCADILVSDYSSVFCDFAVSGKKIILFPYDYEDAYVERRGLYLGINRFCFPIVKTIETLVAEINNAEFSYEDFPADYKAYKVDHLAERLLALALEENTENLVIRNTPDNGKPLVVYNLGSLTMRKRHAGILEMIDCIDSATKNVVLVFQSPINKSSTELLNHIPENISYVRIMPVAAFDLQEKLYIKLNEKFGWFKDKNTEIMKKEFNRLFYQWKIAEYHNLAGSNTRIDRVISTGIAQNRTAGH